MHLCLYIKVVMIVLRKVEAVNIHSALVGHVQYQSACWLLPTVCAIDHPLSLDKHSPYLTMFVHVSSKSLELQYYFICKISGFHGGDYEEWCLLGCYAV
jgi:hypothetical protein